MRIYSLSTLENLVASWASERNLINGATPQAQMLKMTEEIGELANAVARKDQDKLQDSIGDVFVVLVILARQHGVTLEICGNLAYAEIKDRKGKMIDGIFVKEEDLG